jgi:hypothetical protein
MRASALSSEATPFKARVFLEHDADGVNEFFVQAGVATYDHLIARASAWPHM